MSDKPDFRKTTPQTLYDSWRQKERTLLYSGTCIVCGSRVYDFADGQNDPRGVLGEKRSNSGITITDVEGTEHEFPLCFDCGNKESTYQRAERIVQKRLATLNRIISAGHTIAQQNPQKNFSPTSVLLDNLLAQTVTVIHAKQTQHSKK